MFPYIFHHWHHIKELLKFQKTTAKMEMQVPCTIAFCTIVSINGNVPDKPTKKKIGHQSFDLLKSVECRTSDSLKPTQ